MSLQLFLTGLISLLGQISLLRELHVAYFGIELIYIIALSIWMMGTAAGAAFGKKQTVPDNQKLNFLFFIFGLTFLFELVFVRMIRVVFSDIPGAFLPFHLQLLALSLSILPPGFISGFLFQQVARKSVSRHYTFIKAYAVESFGAVAGGIISTALIWLEFNNFLILVLCVWIVFFNAARNWVVNSVRNSVLLLTAFIASLMFTPNLDRTTSRITHPNFFAGKDTPAGRFIIEKSDQYFSFFSDDALVFYSNNYQAEELVHIPFAFDSGLKSVALTGNGYAGILAELLKHELSDVTYFETNKILLEFLESGGFPLPHFPGDRLKILYSDFRQSIDNTGKFDLILIGNSEPHNLQTNRFFTSEFFSLCYEKLNPNGMLVFRLKSSENINTIQLSARNGSILAALKTIFPQIIIFPGATNTIVAFRGTPRSTAGQIPKNFARLNINTALVSEQYLHYLVNNDRFLTANNLKIYDQYRPNSDFAPVCFQMTIAVWLGKFFPQMNSSSIADSNFNNVIIILFILFLALFFVRGFTGTMKSKAVYMAFVSGMTGIFIETLIIFNYQTHHGNLFEMIGLLMTAFMAGLSGGAYFGQKIIVLYNITNLKWYIALPAILFLSACAGLIFIFQNIHFYPGIIINLLILIFSGISVALIFTCSGFLYSSDQLSLISPLYAADLVGAAIGSLMISLVLFPFFGVLFVLVLIMLLNIPLLFLI